MAIRLDDLELFKAQALQWAATFDVCCYLDSNNFNDPYRKFDLLIAAGVKQEIIGNCGSAFDNLEAFRKNNQEWLTGFFTYDLKNESEELSSDNQDHLYFPDLYFFQPQYVIIIKGKEATFVADDEAALARAIQQQTIQTVQPQIEINIQARFNKAEYIETVNLVKTHINRGDIYVTNFCQEFFADNAVIDPLTVFKKLKAISPNPFAGFFKLKDKYILSASPERFLAKRGHKLISQPIKGTSARKENAEEDEASKKSLKADSKELQENVMIVDLVRNDLTRSARPGTVVTKELFGIYSFKQIHQMISTVTCELSDELTTVKAIKNAFPMGSMTGAPKLRSMQLMEKYERSKRGVYSGALGYFSPDGDFDFSVIIRTLLYNAANQYLSFQAGSAITYHADAEKEYAECLLKIKGILNALGGQENFD